MNIIDRTSISESIEVSLIYKNCETFLYDELIDLINRAKTYLIKERNAKAGDQVIICQGDYYVPWFYACCELGLAFVIADHPSSTGWETFNAYFGEIHHVIKESTDESVIPFDVIYQDAVFEMNDIIEYSNDECKNVFLATPNSILTRAIKNRGFLDLTQQYNIEEHSHEYYYHLMERNAKLYNLVLNDRCFHTKILHHGTVLGVIFLSAMKYCKYHFWDCTQVASPWVDHIEKFKITRCMTFYHMIDWLKYVLNKTPRDLSHVTFYDIRQPAPSQIAAIVEKCNATIVSVFGMTETSGPLFLQTINPQNYQSYDRKNFNKPLDDFFKFRIENGFLIVDAPDRTIYTQDKFEIRDGDYYFLN